MTIKADAPEPLPGLEAVERRATGDLEKGVRRTLAKLYADGYVTEADAGKTALAIELAQVMTGKRASGRVSTVANDARVLMEILDSFTPEDAAAGDALLMKAMEEWEEVVHGDRATPDPGTEVRDGP